MKISDLDENEIKVGLKLRSKTGTLAVIVGVNHLDRELWCQILFDDKTYPSGMFISWMDKFNYDVVMTDDLLSDKAKEWINYYPKCKCKDCNENF